MIDLRASSRSRLMSATGSSLKRANGAVNSTGETEPRLCKADEIGPIMMAINATDSSCGSLISKSMVRTWAVRKKLCACLDGWPLPPCAPIGGGMLFAHICEDF